MGARTGQPPALAPDATAMRAVLGRFATGVVAVTGLHRGEPVGLAVNSFASVSLSPPLVSFCVGRRSVSWPLLRRTGALAVSILAESQREVCRALATSGLDKFRGLRWSASPGGLPILPGAMAWLECAVEAEHPAGDHDIVVAGVRHLYAESGHNPLIFFRGRYGSFTDACTPSEHGP